MQLSASRDPNSAGASKRAPTHKRAAVERFNRGAGIRGQTGEVSLFVRRIAARAFVARWSPGWLVGTTSSSNRQTWPNEIVHNTGHI